MTSPISKEERQPLAGVPAGGGRMGTYAVFGAAVSVIPAPWVPDAIAKQIRGALAHDVAARHGLSLSPEARKLLAEPGGGGNPHGLAAQAAKFVAGKVLARFGPLGFLSPLRSALTTYAFGHLLDRYFDVVRKEHAVRVDADEARRVRNAIDGALLETFSTDLEVKDTPAASAPEELRDQLTRIIDGVIITFAGLPDRMVHRLDAAFDSLLASGR